MAKKNRKPYKFQDIKHSIDGIVSIGLELLSVGLVIFEMILTIRARGQAGGFAGYIGFAALLFSVMGLVFAISSWKDEESNDTTKRIGTMFGIIVTLINVILLIMGIAG